MARRQRFRPYCLAPAVLVEIQVFMKLTKEARQLVTTQAMAAVLVVGEEAQGREQRLETRALLQLAQAVEAAAVLAAILPER